jgi:excisionase family DNA binding protein
MNDILFTPIRLNELETLIEHSVERALKAQTPKPDAEPEQNELLTIQQASELLHLTVPTIYTKSSKGELPGVYKQGKRLYFDKQVLTDWIRSGRKKSNAEVEAKMPKHI